MDRRELKDLCRDTLRQLGMRPPLDVHELCERLGAQRGRPIELVPTTELPPNSAFGITGGDDSCDVIMYEARTTWTHQRLIILHELAHMILRHPRRAVDHSYDSAYAQEFRMISPETLAEVLGPGWAGTPAEPVSRSDRPRWPLRRSSADRSVPATSAPRSLYDNPIEWEAETMATIMLPWVTLGGPRPTSACEGKLMAALGDTAGW
ncbi:hypothetical protein [Pseudonocardia sp. H11422]|uniref:hypothetical protein n=1 Tax=Pseudonocardia sp. H11422 TaxID=2835866 RepID=UPI001BDD7FEE|nr:hypothetical protein [Pseudonocardia sp. H11422]